MGVALLDKNVSNRKSFIHTIIKVCAKFQELNVLVTIKSCFLKQLFYAWPYMVMGVV